MSKDKKDTSSEDPLWQEITKTIKPLKNRPEPKPLPPRKRFIKTNRSFSPTMSVSNNVSSPSTIDKNTLRNITQGKLAINHVLDLHDDTQKIAEERLYHALSRAATAQQKCLLIITGKGRNRNHNTLPPEQRKREDFAIGSGALKRMLPIWLCSDHMRPFVHSYAPAHQKHGGEGAFYVLLRRLNPKGLS